VRPRTQLYNHKRKKPPLVSLLTTHSLLVVVLHVVSPSLTVNLLILSRYLLFKLTWLGKGDLYLFGATH
jgi:hypothetical protein